MPEHSRLSHLSALTQVDFQARRAMACARPLPSADDGGEDLAQAVLVFGVQRAELAEHQVGFDGCDQRLDD